MPYVTVLESDIWNNRSRKVKNLMLLTIQPENIFSYPSVTCAQQVKMGS